MHKMRKLLLLLLFPLVMLSCGANKYYGYYAFQLGPDKGDHFGFYLDLTKNDYVDPEGEIKGKKEFKFGMRVSESMVPDAPEYDPDDFDGYLERAFVYLLIQFLNTESPDGIGASGHYSIGNKDIEGKGRKLDLTIVIADIDDPDLGKILQRFIIAYVDGKSINAILPVSLDAFRYQLCWYGIYISVTETAGIPDLDVFELSEYGTLPGPESDEERLGTHPTEKEIAEMNDGRFDEVFGDDKFVFKDWNTLTVTLLKK